MGTFSTTDVGRRIDVFIDGQGYMFPDFVNDKAIFTNTDTFTTRANTDANSPYGDIQQAFWLTWAQRDWSKGEQQKYQGRDEDGKARYWAGQNVDITIPGEISMRKDTTTLSFAANVTAVAGEATSNLAYATTSTNLYSVNQAGTITSIGAHGLGTSPAKFGLVSDGMARYMSSSAVSKIRKEVGGVFTDFNTTNGVDSLAFVNNTLYGYANTGGSKGNLFQFSSGGAATSKGIFQGADGANSTGEVKLVAFGGKLLLLRLRTSIARGAELWIFDGTAPSKVAEFPGNFLAYDCEVFGSTVFVSGVFQRYYSNILFERPAVMFYKDGSQDLLWQADGYVDASGGSTNFCPAISPYDNGMIWNDAYTGSSSDGIKYYNSTNGGISTINNGGTFSSSQAALATAGSFFMSVGIGSTNGFVYPVQSGAAPSSAFIRTSLIDFDTSLRKVFRGVRVEWDSNHAGGGGTVDLAYRYDDLDGAYTTIATGVTSGVETNFNVPSEGTTFQSISIQVKLNKGGSTTGPKIKRISVRAIPYQPVFKRRQYTILLSGRDGDSPLTDRTGQPFPLDGKDMLTNLQTASARTAPFTIADHFGSYTGIIEKMEATEYKQEQWTVSVICREV